MLMILEQFYFFQRVDILKCMLDVEVDKKDLKPDTKGEVALDRNKIIYFLAVDFSSAKIFSADRGYATCESLTKIFSIFCWRFVCH